MPASLKHLVLAAALGLAALELLGIVLHVACPRICLRARALPITLGRLNVSLEVGQYHVHSP